MPHAGAGDFGQFQGGHPFGFGTPGGFLGLNKFFDPTGFNNATTRALETRGSPKSGVLNREVTDLSRQGMNLLQGLFDRNQDFITGQHRDALQGILNAIPQDFDAQRAAGRGQITQQSNQLRQTATQGAARRGLSSGGSQASTASTNLGLGSNLARQSLDQDIENRESQVAQFKAAIESNDLTAMTQLLAGIDAARTFGQVGITGDLASATQAQLSSISNEALIRELSDKLAPDVFQEFILKFGDILGVKGFSTLDTLLS